MSDSLRRLNPCSILLLCLIIFSFSPLFFGCNGKEEKGEKGENASLKTDSTNPLATSKDEFKFITPADSLSDSITVTLYMAENAEEMNLPATSTFGCGDVLQGKEYRVANRGNLLAETFRALLAPQNDFPSNYVAGGTVRLDSAAVDRGIARIYMGGELVLAGVCDHPRIEAQLRATAMQFPEVDSVIVYVGSQTLKEYLSLGG